VIENLSVVNDLQILWYWNKNSCWNFVEGQNILDISLLSFISLKRRPWQRLLKWPMLLWTFIPVRVYSCFEISVSLLHTVACNCGFIIVWRADECWTTFTCTKTTATGWRGKVMQETGWQRDGSVSLLVLWFLRSRGCSSNAFHMFYGSKFLSFTITEDLLILTRLLRWNPWWDEPGVVLPVDGRWTKSQRYSDRSFYKHTHQMESVAGNHRDQTVQLKETKDAICKAENTCFSFSCWFFSFFFSFCPQTIMWKICCCSAVILFWYFGNKSEKPTRLISVHFWP